MNHDDASLWTDRTCLQDAQYRTDANLAARQSIYAYRHPPLDLPSVVLGLANLRGVETVTDIGCGNGAYLAELARREHKGQVLGVDLSVGMLDAARSRAPRAALVAGDAAALPLRDNASDLSLAMHMLFHVPDPQAAVRELRRVTRPGGQVLIALNGADHLRELRELMAAVAQELHVSVTSPGERLHLNDGENILASQFTSVTRYDFTGELLIPNPRPVAEYARSMASVQELTEPEGFVAAVASLVPSSDQGIFRIAAHNGCLICS
jgi:SAM-dependent methyltransferase